MKVLLDLIGIGPWRVSLWPPEGRTDMDRIYQGRPADFTAHMAFAELGRIEIELIQSPVGRSIWDDYLVEHGPGLPHIRFNVPMMEPIIERVAEHGIGVAQGRMVSVPIRVGPISIPNGLSALLSR